MKLNRLLLVALTGLAPAFVFAVGPKANASSHPSGRAEVQFLEAEKFTDVGGGLDDKSDKKGYLTMLRDHVDRLAGEYMPEGQKIALTFTDIDLAGDFPPASRAARDSVRVMKDIYPPRMAFSYRITDASGAVVKEGREELTDKNFLTTGAMTDRSDPLRYDKMLLSDWFRSQFAKK
jgi:hypothetical protein